MNQHLTIQTDTRVELKAYIAREPLNYELMSDKEIADGSGGTLVVDSECYNNYFLIAFKDIKTNKIIQFEINDFTGECFNEHKLSWIMHSYKTIGFNSIKYDLPMIWLSYARQDTQNLKNASDALIFRNVWPTELQKEFNFKIFKTNHIDLIEVCPLKGSLKLYAARLHAQRIQDLPFDINQPLTEEQIEIVRDYNIADLDDTELLFENLTEQLALRQELSIQYKQDLMSKSDAQIAEAVIGSELKRITGKWPSKPKIDSNIKKYKIPSCLFFQTEKMNKVLKTIADADYEVLENGRLVIPKEIEGLKINIGKCIYRIGIGGLHSSEKEISIKADDEYELIDKDVASYYPAIVLNLGLYPTHIGTDFLTVYKTLVDRRLLAKKNKQIAIAECLKITINGTFGKTGSPYSFLYAPEMTIQITVGGQLFLLMLIERIELINDNQSNERIEVVSANTDGILIKCHKNKKEELDNIVLMWEKITNFVTEENQYAAIHSRDVNAYIAVKKEKDGKQETKGKNVYYDPWQCKTARDGYWRFQVNPKAQICVKAIEQLLLYNIPIEKTIRECKHIQEFICVRNVTGGAHKDRYYLGKVIRWYHATDINGTINYIKNDNKVPDTEGAKPCMDLPKQLPIDINYAWYIAKTIDMLYDCGYYQRPQQIKFF